MLPSPKTVLEDKLSFRLLLLAMVYHVKVIMNSVEPQKFLSDSCLIISRPSHDFPPLSPNFGLYTYHKLLKTSSNRKKYLISKISWNFELNCLKLYISKVSQFSNISISESDLNSKVKINHFSSHALTCNKKPNCQYLVYNISLSSGDKTN